MTIAESLVFVIDDDASVRKDVARLLRAAGHESEIFASASDFLTRPPHSGPSCVIVDVQMPGINGMDLQKALIQRGREEQLVFITGHGDIPMCAQAMKAVALDFLPKPFRADKLLQCVQNALIRSAEQRLRSVEENEARRLLDLLTPREFEVLQLVMTGMLNKQIAGELGICLSTLKVHRRRGMRKLEITSVPELIRLLQKAGAAGASVGSGADSLSNPSASRKLGTILHRGCRPDRPSGHCERLHPGRRLDNLASNRRLAAEGL
jgi:FixJ family two-component response regulator